LKKFWQSPTNNQHGEQFKPKQSNTMATEKSKNPAEFVFEWEGKDRNGKQVRGEMRAGGENQVQAALRRQGVIPSKVKKRRMSSGKAIKPKDMAIFTRQLATMMKAGVPLLQAFDIVGRGNPNPSVTRLLNDIRTDVETGTSLSAAFRKYPLYFDNLYCNLVEAGEAAGILDQLLDRLAVYMEKTEAMKSKIKSALMYPISVLIVAFVVTAVIMIFVVPSFKQVFTSFGADLPAPTLLVIAVSEFFVSYWWLIFGGLGGGFYFFMQAWRRNQKVQIFMDKLMLKMPIFGVLVEKSSIARWTRTLSTMFAAGVPLVEALDSVGGAAGNWVFESATIKIQQEVSTGTALTVAMTNANLFPSMVLQMCAIGEESGSIDHMLGKSADFYESEVDDMVAGISSLMEPIIIVVLGGVIGGIVVAMYLPIFKLGQVV
jgi:type IV pilus assembly protein PilC